MLNWIVWNRTVYMYKNGFGIKPNQTKSATRVKQPVRIKLFSLMNWFILTASPAKERCPGYDTKMHRPVGWGCRIHRLQICRRVILSPMSVLDRIWKCWSIGECRVPLHCYYSQVHSDPEWLAHGSHIYGLNRTKKWITLNWIVWK